MSDPQETVRILESARKLAAAANLQAEQKARQDALETEALEVRRSNACYGAAFAVLSLPYIIMHPKKDENV